MKIVLNNLIRTLQVSAIFLIISTSAFADESLELLLPSNVVTVGTTTMNPPVVGSRRRSPPPIYLRFVHTRDTENESIVVEAMQWTSKDEGSEPQIISATTVNHPSSQALIRDIHWDGVTLKYSTARQETCSATFNRQSVLGQPGLDSRRTTLAVCARPK